MSIVDARVGRLSADFVIISLILAKFTNALVRSRPLKEIGAEQVFLRIVWSPQVN